MLIIDPATGAMYKLETEFIYETLSKSTAGLEKSEINIYGLYQIPDDWKDHLIKINK